MRHSNIPARLILLAATLFATASCSDDLSPTFSQKNIVRCDLLCTQYIELHNVVGNFGQFASIRQSGGKLVMQNASTTTSYAMTAEQGRYFLLGLGGLIVGINYEGEMRAYDLSCPNCDRTERRLTLSNDGTAQCGGNNCHIKYDLNHDGVILEKPANCTHAKPRGLYRYRITYDGLYIHIYN